MKMVRLLIYLTTMVACLCVTPAWSALYSESFEGCEGVWSEPRTISSSPISWNLSFGDVRVSKSSSFGNDTWAIDGSLSAKPGPPAPGGSTNRASFAYTGITGSPSVGKSYALRFKAYATQGSLMSGLSIGIGSENKPYGIGLWIYNGVWRFDARYFIKEQPDWDAQYDFYWYGGINKPLDCQIIIDSKRHVTYALIGDSSGIVRKSKEFAFTPGREAKLSMVDIYQYMYMGWDSQGNPNNFLDGLDVDDIVFEEITPTLLMQDFAGCSGWSGPDSISRSPISWTVASGSVKASSSTYFGAGNWAIDGSLSNTGDNRAYRPLSMSIIGQSFSLNFKAYSTDRTATSGVHLGTNGGSNAVGLWRHSDGWSFDAGLLASDVWNNSNLDERFYVSGNGRVLDCQVVVDVMRHVTYGVITDDSGIHKSREIPFLPGRELMLKSVAVCQRLTSDHNDGLDVDDISVEQAPVPTAFFAEDFRACESNWSGADSIGRAPISWTINAGDVKAGKSSHFGNSDWAIDGSLSNFGGNFASRPIARLFRGESFALRFKAYATNATTSSGVALGSTARQTPLGLWRYTTGWTFDAGWFVSDSWDSNAVDSNFYTGGIDKVVDCQVVVDLIRHVTYATVTDDAGIHKSREIPFLPGRELMVTKTTVYQHLTAACNEGLDIDDISVEQAGWRPHRIKQSDGAGGWREIPGEYQILGLRGTEKEREIIVPMGLVQMDNGVVALLASSEIGSNQRVVISFSADRGDTWSDWQTITVNSEPVKTRPTEFACLSGGRLTFETVTTVCDPACRVLLESYFSNDYGKTWSKDPVRRVGGLHTEGTPLTEGQSTIAVIGYEFPPPPQYWPWYPCSSWLRWSYDGGHTWTEATTSSSWLLTYSYQGQQYTRSGSEGSIIRANNGRLVAAFRTDIHPRFYIHGQVYEDSLEGLGVSYSDDNGLTWSPIRILFQAGRHHPVIVKMHNGDLLMTFVRRDKIADDDDILTDHYRGCDALISRDNGLTWDTDNIYVLHEFEFYDPANWMDGECGHHATVVLDDNRVLSVYGAHLTKGAVLVRWTPYAAGAVTFRLVIEDYIGDITKLPVTVELRRLGGSVETVTVSPDAEGRITITDVQPGTYDVAIGASGWLKKVIRNVQVDL